MRNRYVLAADVLAIGAAVCAAFALRFDAWFLLSRPEFTPYLVAALVVKPVVFFLFGMYRRFWRYANIQDLIALGFANCAASVVMGLFVAIEVYRGGIYEFSRSALVADWLFCIGSTAFVRLSVRVIAETQTRRTASSDSEKRILVVGAGDAGILVTREMQRNPQLGMTPVAFVDDDPVKIGKRICGVPVIGTLAQIADSVVQHDVGEVVIAMPKAHGDVVRVVTDACRRMSVASRIMPGVFELLDGKVGVSRLRQVDITDLLRRNPVDTRAQSPAYVSAATVLVTGAGGSIGYELSRQVAHARPRRLVLLGHGENSIFEAESLLREACPTVPIESVIADIRDRARIVRVFEAVRPDVVFHAAAHKHVPLMQANPEEAISNNVIGTQNVVDAAERVRAARFVMISSDKAVSPASLMGASKRVAEAVVRHAARRSGAAFVVVRFGNVLGSRGSVVPYFKKQIEAGGPITVTHPEMKRFFMTIPEAVHLVLQAGGMGLGGEVYVLKMGEPLRVIDLARDLIRLSGLNQEDVPIVFSGLRPGEKLEEMLWEPDAAVQETTHPDLMRVMESHQPEGSSLERLVEVLARAAVQGDRSAIEAALHELVPTFGSQTLRV